MDAGGGVEVVRQWLDGPGRVQGVDPDVQGIELLEREDVVPGGAQLEQALPGVLIHLHTEHRVLGALASAHLSPQPTNKSRTPCGRSLKTRQLTGLYLFKDTNK